MKLARRRHFLLYSSSFFFSNLFWLGLITFRCKECVSSWSLEEKLYLEISLGFDTTGRRNKVCLLEKVIYGPEQFPKTWFRIFTKVVVSLGYKQSMRSYSIHKALC